MVHWMVSEMPTFEQTLISVESSKTQLSSNDKDVTGVLKWVLPMSPWATKVPSGPVFISKPITKLKWELTKLFLDRFLKN